MEYKTLKKKLINISNTNTMIKTTGKGRYQIDLSEFDISKDEFSDWVRNRDETPLVIEIESIAGKDKLKELETTAVLIAEARKKLSDVDNSTTDDIRKAGLKTELEQEIYKYTNELSSMQSKLDKEVRLACNKFSVISKRSEEIRKQTGKYTAYIGLMYITGEIKVGQIINAPILLFPVSIQSSNGRIIIYHNNEKSILSNLTMLTAIRLNLGFNVSTKVIEGEQLDDFVSDTETFSDLICGISHCEYSSNGLELSRITTETKQRGLRVYTGAVIGVFDTSSSIYNDYDKMEEDDNKLIYKLFNGSDTLGNDSMRKLKGEYKVPEWRAHDLNLVSQLDQSQEYAVFMADKADSLVIYGPPGTGKSQVILNIIADQASKGKKVLLVSQKITALMVIFNRLGSLRAKAMLVEDSGSSKASFISSISSSIDTLEYKEVASIESKISLYASRIDEALQKLDTIHKVLTTPLEITGIDMSFMYKNSKSTPENEIITLKIMHNYPDIFSYSLKELYDSYRNINSRYIDDAYKAYINTNNIERFKGISRLQLVNSINLVSRLNEIKKAKVELNNSIHVGMTRGPTYGEYKRKLNLIDTLLGLCNILYETEYCVENTEINTKISEERIEEEALHIYSKLSNLNIGTTTININGMILNIDNVEDSVANYVEKKNIDVIDIACKIKDSKASNYSGSEVIDVEEINTVNYLNILNIQNTFESLIEAKKVVYNTFGIVECNSDQELAQLAMEQIETRYEHNKNIVTSCIQLYNNIKAETVHDISIEDCEGIVANIGNMCPSRRNIITKVFNVYDAEDKNKLSKLYCALNVLNEIKEISKSTLERQLNYLESELVRLNFLIKTLTDSLDVTIANVEDSNIVFNASILKQAADKLQKVEEEKQEIIGEAHKLIKYKLETEANIEKETAEIATMLGIENNTSILKNNLYRLVELTEGFIETQEEMIRNMVKLQSEEVSISDKLREIGVGELSDKDIESVSNLVSNIDSIEIINSLSDIDKLLMQIKYREELSIKDIINSYIFYYIDKIENKGIQQSLIARYNEYTATVSKLEKEKSKLTSKLVEANISYNIINNESMEDLQKIQKEIKGSKTKKSMRQIMAEYTSFMYGLFPIWLMTPETVSDILPLRKDDFDLVIFDEASQLFIERTIPSLYRAKKAIVAGDDKQLKPTSFFMSVRNNDEESEGELTEGLSLLDQAKSTFSSVKLSFHYRSKYSELIQFSNYAFYNSLLKICPNTLSQSAEFSPIEYIKIPGKCISNSNPLEGQYIANLIKDIISKEGYEADKKSIGIITFNIKQKECIEDQISEFISSLEEDDKTKFNELMTRETNGEDTSLFVKNIEEVQGDERDIIIFSLGYGYDEEGKLHTNLGPLKLSGGENRLNVAISRAKEKEYIITSINPEDLKVDTAKNMGPKLFKEFLMFARAVSNKEYELANQITKSIDISEKESIKFDSPFEEDVFNALVELGWKVETQVGVRGYRIDLAVYDDKTGTYLAGIECDGATYHSSKYARERDISRQRFLEGKGWKILRIWSRDWWHNSRAQVEIINTKLKELQNNSVDSVEEHIRLNESDEYITLESLENVMKDSSKVEDSIIKHEVIIDSLSEDREDLIFDTEIRETKETDTSISNLVDSKSDNSTIVYNIYNTNNGMELIEIEKEKIKGRKIKSIQLMGKSIECKAWWEIVKHSLYYKLQLMAINNGKEIQEENVMYSEYLVIKLINNLNYPAWIVTDKTTVRNPIQILNTKYFMDITGDAFGLVKRAVKLIDGQSNIITVQIDSSSN